jgi:hypothetical protein
MPYKVIPPEQSIPALGMAAEAGDLSPEHLHALEELVLRSRAILREREFNAERQRQFLATLEGRFAGIPERYNRQEGIVFAEVKKALEARPDIMYKLWESERRGGEPDIVAIEDGCYVFVEFSKEAPVGRGSLASELVNEAAEMGVEMVDPARYSMMNAIGGLDMQTKTVLHDPSVKLNSGSILYGEHTQFAGEDEPGNQQYRIGKGIDPLSKYGSRWEIKVPMVK